MYLFNPLNLSNVQYIKFTFLSFELSHEKSIISLFFLVNDSNVNFFLYISFDDSLIIFYQYFIY